MSRGQPKVDYRIPAYNSNCENTYTEVTCDLCVVAATTGPETAKWTTMTRGVVLKVDGYDTYDVFVVDLCGSCGGVMADLIMGHGLLKNYDAKQSVVLGSNFPAGNCPYCQRSPGAVHHHHCAFFHPAWREHLGNPRPEPEQPDLPPRPAVIDTTLCKCGHTRSRHLPELAGRCAGSSPLGWGSNLSSPCSYFCSGFELPQPSRG